MCNARPIAAHSSSRLLCANQPLLRTMGVVLVSNFAVNWTVAKFKSTLFPASSFADVFLVRH